jgi:hypothetical protein
MFSEADEELGELERRMLSLAKSELSKYEDNDSETKPLPLSLVTLLTKAHQCVLARLSKRTGMDLNLMKKNPEAALLQLERMKALIIKEMEQRDKNKNVGKQ